MSKLLIYIIFIVLYGCKYTEPTDLIINKKESGWYAVIHNCKNGVEKNYVDGRLQYKFPENKILYTAYPQKLGVIDYRFFFYEKDEKREFFLPTHKEVDNNFVAMGPVQLSTKIYNRTIFYFGDKNDIKRSNKNLKLFAKSIDKYIIENELKCGKNYIE